LLGGNETIIEAIDFENKSYKNVRKYKNWPRPNEALASSKFRSASSCAVGIGYFSGMEVGRGGNTNAHRAGERGDNHPHLGSEKGYWLVIFGRLIRNFDEDIS